MACPADFTGIATDSRGNVLRRKDLRFANFNTTTEVASTKTTDKGRFTVSIADATVNKIDVYEGITIPAAKQTDSFFLGTINLNVGLLNFCENHFGDAGDCHAIGDLQNPDIFDIINHYNKDENTCAEFWKLGSITPDNFNGAAVGKWLYSLVPSSGGFLEFAFGFTDAYTPLSAGITSNGDTPIFYNRTLKPSYMGSASGFAFPSNIVHPFNLTDSALFDGVIHYLKKEQFTLNGSANSTFKEIRIIGLADTSTKVFLDISESATVHTVTLYTTLGDPTGSKIAEGTKVDPDNLNVKVKLTEENSSGVTGLIVYDFVSDETDVQIDNDPCACNDYYFNNGLDWNRFLTYAFSDFDPTSNLCASRIYYRPDSCATGLKGFKLGVNDVRKSEAVKLLSTHLSADKNLIQFDFKPEFETFVAELVPPPPEHYDFLHEGNGSDGVVFRKTGTTYEFILFTNIGGPGTSTVSYTEGEVEQYFIGKPNVTIQIAWDRSVAIDGLRHMFVKINGNLLIPSGESGQSPWTARDYSLDIYLGTNNFSQSFDFSYPGVYSNLKIYNDTTATALIAEYKLDDNLPTDVVLATTGSNTTLSTEGTPINTDTVFTTVSTIGDCLCHGVYKYHDGVLWNTFMNFVCASSDPNNNLYESRIYYKPSACIDTFTGFKLGVNNPNKSEGVKILTPDLSVDKNLIQFDFKPENETIIPGVNLLHFLHEGVSPTQSDSMVFRKVGTKYIFEIQVSSGPTLATLEYDQGEVESHFVGKPNVTIQIAWDRSVPINGTHHMFVKINGTLLNIIGVAVNQSPWAANDWGGGIYLGERNQVTTNDLAYPGIYSNLKIYNDTAAAVLIAEYKLDDNGANDNVNATVGNDTNIQEHVAPIFTLSVSTTVAGTTSCDCSGFYNFYNGNIWQKFMSYVCENADPTTGLYPGRIYYNELNNVFRFFNGTIWIDFGGGVGSLDCFEVDHNACDGSAVEGWHHSTIRLGTSVTDYLTFQRVANILEIHPGRDDTAGNKEDEAILGIENLTTMPFRTTFLIDTSDPGFNVEVLRPLKIYSKINRSFPLDNVLFLDDFESVYTGVISPNGSPNFFGLVFREQNILIDRVKSELTSLFAYPSDIDRAFENKGRTSFSRDVQKPVYFDGIKWRRYNQWERGNGEQNRTPNGYYYERDESARFILKWTIKGQLFTTDFGRTWAEVADTSHVYVWRMDGDYDSGVLEDITDVGNNTNHTAGTYTLGWDQTSSINLVESIVDGSKFIVWGEFENYKNIIEPGVNMRVQGTSSNNVIMIGRPPFTHALEASFVAATDIFTHVSGDALNAKLRTTGMIVVLKKGGTKHTAKVTAITSTTFTVDDATWSPSDPGDGTYDVELFYNDELEIQEQATTGSILESIGNKGNEIVWDRRSGDTELWGSIKFFHKMILDYNTFDNGQDVHDNAYNGNTSEIWIINNIFKTGMQDSTIFISDARYHLRCFNNDLQKSTSQINIVAMPTGKAERIWVMNNIVSRIRLSNNNSQDFKMIRNNWLQDATTPVEQVGGASAGTVKTTDAGENGYSSTIFANIDSLIGRQLYKGNFVGATFPSASKAQGDSLNPYESLGYNLVDDYFCGLGPGEYDRIGFIHSFVSKNLKDVTASLVFLLKNARDASTLPLINFAQSGGSDVSNATMGVQQSNFNGTFNAFAYGFSTALRCWFVDLLYDTAPAVNTFFHIKYQDNVSTESI